MDRGPHEHRRERREGDSRCERLDVVGDRSSEYQLGEAEQERAAIEDRDREQVHQCQVCREDGDQREQGCDSLTGRMAGELGDADDAGDVFRA